MRHTVPLTIGLVGAVVVLTLAGVTTARLAVQDQDIAGLARSPGGACSELASDGSDGRVEAALVLRNPGDTPITVRSVRPIAETGVSDQDLIWAEADRSASPGGVLFGEPSTWHGPAADEPHMIAPHTTVLLVARFRLDADARSGAVGHLRVTTDGMLGTRVTETYPTSVGAARPRASCTDADGSPTP